jgi:hypothetical protein
MTNKVGHLSGWFFGVVVLWGLLAVPGCSGPPSENVVHVPKESPKRDDIQKTEYERDKAAKASGKAAAPRAH